MSESNDRICNAAIDVCATVAVFSKSNAIEKIKDNDFLRWIEGLRDARRALDEAFEESSERRDQNK